jgi:hypothetical protein
MTQSIGAIRNMLLSRLVVMKKEIEYNESLRGEYLNQDSVLETLNNNYNKAVQAYELLNDLCSDGYETYGFYLEAEDFANEEA